MDPKKDVKDGKFPRTGPYKTIEPSQKQMDTARFLSKGFNIKDSLKAAGYSESTARTGRYALQTRGMEEALARYGLSLSKIDTVVGSIMNNPREKPENRLRAADLGYKRQGAYVEKHLNLNVQVDEPSIADGIKSRLKDRLYATTSTPTPSPYTRDIATADSDHTIDVDTSPPRPTHVHNPPAVEDE